MVCIMTTGSGGPPPDLYGVLGVGPAASGEEITRAWRQRARTEHPDARPRDAGAPARFRALAEAYRVLGDPARRAAYDLAAGHPPRPQGRARPPRPDPAAPLTGVPGAPLRAGPVRVEAPGPAPVPRLAADEADWLAWLVLRYLTDGRGRPW
jgi:curved DNA-binding protein CbpA